MGRGKRGEKEREMAGRGCRAEGREEVVELAIGLVEEEGGGGGSG